MPGFRRTGSHKFLCRWLKSVCLVEDKIEDKVSPLTGTLSNLMCSLYYTGSKLMMKHVNHYLGQSTTCTELGTLHFLFHLCKLWVESLYNTDI